jgi:hypothetical protein
MTTQKKIDKAKNSDAEGIGKRIKSGPSGDVTTSTQPPQSNIESPSAYDIFLKTIKRANNLVDTHKEGEECCEEHLDSFRAAVVLSISALDAYTRTLVIEKILVQLSEPTKEIPEKLKIYIKGLLNQDALLEAGRKYQFKEKVEKSIRADFETKSFQGEYKIDFYMELAGYKNIFEKVTHSANKSESRLRADIEKYTKRRHVIAHCGDYDLTQIPHTEKDIDKEFAKHCIEIVIVFAEHLNKVTK